MELYEKKFPIYENCMIRMFGQPENAETNQICIVPLHFLHRRSNKKIVERYFLVQGFGQSIYQRKKNIC